MIESSLMVYTDELQVRTINRLNGAALEFVYDENCEGRTPISYTMSLDVARNGDRVVTPFLWNLLPDDLRLFRT